MSLFTCRCDYCGKRRFKMLSKAYPSIWEWWKVYRFCNRECAKAFIDRSRAIDIKRWHMLFTPITDTKTDYRTYDEENNL
ncbi:hypothetical protein DFQ50_108314 [Pseudocitrobacter faecalis]|uniref:MYM-type domain-containing protein n=1 Tax=Pseudocitrobacter faecalis TaxID=1398493 RepID=A0ABX9FTS9_9ENTR|nr:hypothetical protein DFQ50_108314 [Pseudocitrobacter faecalis]